MLDLLFEEVTGSWQHTTEKVKKPQKGDRESIHSIQELVAYLVSACPCPLLSAFQETCLANTLACQPQTTFVLEVAKHVHTKGMFACRITFQKVPACCPGVQGSFWQRGAVPESSPLVSASFWVCVQAMNSHKPYWCLQKNDVIDHMTSGTYNSNFLHKTPFLQGLLFSCRPSVDCDRPGKGTPVTSQMLSDLELLAL